MAYRTFLAPIFCLVILLTGCAFGPSAPVLPTQGASLRGTAFGGHQPIVGAHVYLLAANTAGYGSPSKSLLDSASTGNAADSIGSYVITDNSGAFTITGDYGCTPDTQVYLLSLGGNPGAGLNSSAGIMAVLGNCPSSGNFLGTIPFIFMDEVTTIAAAYSIAGFATDSTHVSSSGTDAAKIGIANAFAMAANLADVTVGTARATIVAGNGVVPQTRINTLGNILAACINTDSKSSTPCTTLFANTKSPAGVTPTETATAAINLAHLPGATTTAAVTTLYNLTSTLPPYAPALTAAPKDFVIGIKYTGLSVMGVTDIAIDAAGNAWCANSIGPDLEFTSGLTEFSPTGVLLSPGVGFGSGSVIDIENLAIDPHTGVIWAADEQAHNLQRFSTTGVLDPSGPYDGNGTANLGYPNGASGAYIGVAIDLNSNVWAVSPLVPSIDKFNSDGSLASITTPGSGGYYLIPNADGTIWAPGDILVLLSSTGADITPDAILNNTDMQQYDTSAAVDAASNIWVSGYGTLYAATSTGTEISPTRRGFTGGGQDTSTTAADMISDGDSNIWVANYEKNTLTAFSQAYSKMISTSNGFGSGTLAHPQSLAVDGSGNIWVAVQNTASSTVTDGVTELIGIAAPVVTPLTPGKYGVRP